MNDLQIFTSEQFGNVRILEEDGKILFCGSDIARALGYARPNEAVSKHCKGTLKRRTPTTSGIQKMNFIPEGDVYRLIVNSRLPSAEKFEKWVFDEVLPSLRKDGYYATEKKLLSLYKDIANLEKWQCGLDLNRNRYLAFSNLTANCHKQYLDCKKDRNKYLSDIQAIEEYIGILIHRISEKQKSLDLQPNKTGGSLND